VAVLIAGEAFDVVEVLEVRDLVQSRVGDRLAQAEVPADDVPWPERRADLARERFAGVELDCTSPA
jgi:hypothetical protein